MGGRFGCTTSRLSRLLERRRKGLSYRIASERELPCLDCKWSRVVESRDEVTVRRTNVLHVITAVCNEPSLVAQVHRRRDPMNNPKSMVGGMYFSKHSSLTLHNRFSAGSALLPWPVRAFTSPSRTSMNGDGNRTSPATGRVLSWIVSTTAMTHRHISCTLLPLIWCPKGGNGLPEMRHKLSRRQERSSIPAGTPPWFLPALPAQRMMRPDT